MLLLELICSYIFYLLRFKKKKPKKHASLIVVYADAKVVLNVRMIEADISSIASIGADALLQKVGCQVSVFLTHWVWLRGVGRLGGKLCVFSQCRWHYH